MTLIADSYRSQSWSQRILRLWLGVTFIYAGWNKASDSTFFKRGSTHFIGSQLIGFSHGSPLRPLLVLASHQAILVGWLTILTEMAIGIAILLNVASLAAAIAGAFFSLTLWLSSSWPVRPYFLASDPAYFVMWCAYAAGLFQQMKMTLVNPVIGRKRALASTKTDLQRRQVVRIGAVGLLALAGGLLGRLFQSSPTSRKKSAGGTRPVINGGHVLATLASLPVGSAVNFTAKNGDPAVLIRTSTAQVAAFDAVCTHQGCTVAYDKPSQSLVCPCHLSQFDPLAHAAVLSGPAPAPLSEIGVKIDGSNIVLT